MTTENTPRTVRSPLDKIKSLEEMSAVSEKLRGNGVAVVLSHGVFDLLHVGHIQHMRAARRFGDVLCVSITADEYVRKGPDRPVFPAELRAEMLAALEIVDYVVVVPEPSALPSINSVKPTVYAKGSDYKNAKDDITGKIVHERNAVESHGGRIEFTDEITFSSSRLLNEHFNVLDPELKSYLEKVRALGGEDALQGLVDAASEMRVLIVGDAIIDEYCYVRPMGKSAKENMIATRFENNEVFAGGVIAAANHVASFVKEVDLVTAIGDGSDGENYEKLIREALLPNVNLHLIYRVEQPTTRKTRFVDPSYVRKLFEVYSFDDTHLDDADQAKLHALIESHSETADLTIVTDFGHGLISPDTRKVLETKSKFLAINSQANAANFGYNVVTKYNRADYICIDFPEAQLAVREKNADIETVCSSLLPAAIDCPNVVVTHGRAGAYLYQRGRDGALRVPALTKSVVDTVGAGDAFFVVTAPLVAAGAAIEQVGLIGNIAGAIKVGIVGHRQFVDKVSTKKYITTLMK